MNQIKLLKCLLIIAIILDALTLPIWLFTSAIAGAGIPGLILTIILLIAHIRALKNVRTNLPIPQKNITTQLVTGLLLMLLLYGVINLLSLGEGLSRQSLPQVLLNITMILVPAFALYIGVLSLIKKYNKSLSHNTSTNLQ